MKTIIWKSTYYESLEYMQWKKEAELNSFQSTVIGLKDDNHWLLQYKVKTDLQWNLRSFQLHAVVNSIDWVVEGQLTHGKWSINGQERSEFENLKFIDISLTPFTNSLPIQQLNLQLGEEEPIEVMYIDVVHKELSRVQQSFVKLDKETVRYANVPKDFQADITIDEEGLVVDYPGLFVREW